MQEAQAIRSQALHQHVVHVVLLAAEQLIALIPVATHTNRRTRGPVNRNDIRQTQARWLAIFIHVLKAFQIVVNLELQQFHFLIVRIRRDLCHAVCLFLDDVITLIRRATLLCSIQVLTTEHRLAVIIHRHWHHVRDPRALTHHTRSVVRDIQVVRQDQLAHHPVTILVVVHLLKRRATITNIEQQLIKVRCVLFHHRSDLVIHKVPHPVGLHQLLTRLFPQYARAHGPVRGHQFFQCLCLELHNRFCQQRMRRRCSTLERTCALIKGKAKQFQALAILLFPILTRALIRLKQRH